MKTGSFLSSKTCFRFSFVFFALLLGLSNSGRGQARLMIGDAGSGKKDPGVQVAAARPVNVLQNRQLAVKAIPGNLIENNQVQDHNMNAPLAIITSTSTGGNWNATGTWVGGIVPLSSDDVAIASGATVTVNIAAVCNTLTYNAVTTNSLVTISGSNSLSVTNALTMPRPSFGQTCTLNVNAGTLTCGSLIMGATGVNRPDIMNITTGTVTISGTLTTGGAGCQFIITGTGTFNMGGAYTGTPTLSTVSGSTVNYTGSGAQNIYPIDYLGNLGLSGAGTKTIPNIYTSNSLVVHENFINNSTLVVSAGISTLTTNLLLEGNAANNAGATINATADFTRFEFASSNAQTFTNDGTVTSPVASFGVENSNTSGLTLAGANGFIATRVNLFYGGIRNSDKITLGTGGTSFAVVQRGVAANTYPAGSFSAAPAFNVGSGGLNLLYDNGSVAYNTGNEVPSSSSCNAFYIFDAADVTLGSDVTISNELNFYGGTGTPILRIGAHILTIGGFITYTVPGSFNGGATSNLVMNGATTVNAITGGLNNFTINANTTLGGGINVNGTLVLTNGILINGANLTMANGSTISRSGGSLITAPTFAGIVNLLYTGGTAISTGKELPTGTSTLNNFTTNTGGTTQYAYTSGTANLLTDNFPNLTSWTGNKGSGSLQFNSSATANAGGTSPEARFYSAELTHSNATYYIYRGPVNTSGYSMVNVSFKSYATGNYVQNYPTYLKLQSATSTSGPWHDIWSMPYAPHAATNITIPYYSTDVGGNMYFQFVFVGDAYALDYWYFDNLVVDGITNTPVASTATVNGTLDLTNGTYTIGANNTLVFKGGVSGSSAIVGSTTSNLTVAANLSVGGGANLSLPPITAGLNNFSVTRPFGANLGSNLILNGAGNIAANCLLDCGNYVISGGGTFILAPGATLETAHASGVSGSVTVSGAKTLDPAADYVFDGVAAQVTGFLPPATIHNLTIDNAAGVTLPAIETDLTIGGDLTVNSGKKFIVASPKKVTVNGTAYLK